MSEVNAEQLKKQIAILKEVLALRANGAHDSPYVCDNVVCEIDASIYAQDAICADIRQYIDNAWSVREWAEQRDGRVYRNWEVEDERIKMINTLIARYEATLKEAEAA